ncbi:hypothetical protein KDL45_12625, partial [bacterium]|nr:hypothetical protein [bacterium]
EIAGTFHLEILPVDPNRPQSIRFTVIEMSVSDFSLEDIRQVFDENRDQLVEFAKRSIGYDLGLFVDCEWDWSDWPIVEKELQAKETEAAEGFLITSANFFLYVQKEPKKLVDFIKRRRIPKARKVAKEMTEVYESLSS